MSSKAIERLYSESAQKIVDRLFQAVAEFRSGGPPADDMEAVAVRITT